MRTRRNKVGTNQYRVRRKSYWKRYLFIFGLGFLSVVCFAQYYKNVGAEKAYAESPIISPVSEYLDIKQEIEPTLTPERIATQKEIEAYVKTIFGKDARVAIAISHNECNPANARYPRCILHSDVEYSVGLFQINLYNKDQWIHAGRIPGKSMDDKATWLKDPYNNTLYAYWVFQKSGWHPWSAYTNGNYLNDL